MTASKITKHANIAAYPLQAWDILKHKWDIAAPMYNLNLPVSQILMHDYSKFSPDIFPAYAEFFHGERTPEVWAAFRKAYHEHYKREPHHWHDDPAFWGKVEDKPLRYRLETLADTYGAAKRVSKDPNFPEFKEWYSMNKDRFASPELQAHVKLASAISELLAKSEKQTEVIKQLLGADKYEKEMELLGRKQFIQGAAKKLKELSK